MRVDKKLLEQLRARKQVARESYADVVARMIRNEVAPTSIQKMLREKHGKKPRKIAGVCPICNYQNCRCGF